MSAAREAILGRVRSALADVTPTPEPVVPPVTSALTGAEEAHVLDVFVERVVDYKAVVERVSAADLPAHLEGLFAPGQKVLVPTGLPVELAAALPVPVTEDEGLLSAAELDGCDAVVTLSAVGIAETGTIVLDHTAGQGRRALSLVPDRHVCVVRTDQVVPDVPEAVARLAGAVGAGQPLTWISGPSATSDIELDRVEGVHGPRTLHVLLVDGEA
ncbi:LutC/YkgG family protein [Nocardioides bruguierae]|uniref:Lactate utilization protein C n=1 Tax=Nocardioides bruguierae TaxID=2945102 RepID=A0A9X2D8C4_9ACTN|nr:lactate utilization protein C [Nocardioides bruguierae]MCM0620657.1 lactate utilization protein C [Nocardioides bruguierae]